MEIGKILQLKEERINISNQIRSIIDEFENKEIEATKKDELNKLEERFENLNQKIILNEKQLERERSLGEIRTPAPASKETDPNAKVMDAFKNYLVNGTKDSF
jgi:HK97 family phage major capsid protein